MSCPDNLLIGYRRGALSVEEQARLDGHLAGCPTCRLSLRVGSDFDQVLDTVAGDDLIAARFARNLGPKLEQQHSMQARGMRSGGKRFAWVAAALIAVGASAGLAAARLGAWPFAMRAPSPPPSAPQKQTSERATRPARDPLAKPEPAVPASKPVAEEKPTSERPSSERAPAAAELFAQANALRRTGESHRARGLYRQLQQLYPGSAEVEVSYVSLGRLQLELGAEREALEQFERYLATRPRGPLAEEALFGKASALERLGSAAAERRTWQALLGAYPGSVYAERARHRLEQLP